MSPHILVIDDQINLPRFIAMELEAVGYQVSLTYDRTSDARMIQQINPDLIVLNWELRRTSSLHLCRQLNLHSNGIPVVVITAKDEENCQTALSTGAKACLTKPFSINNLLDTIKHHLNLEAKDASQKNSPQPITIH
jgi:DNA-binding response OmpR family regulator